MKTNKKLKGKKQENKRRQALKRENDKKKKNRQKYSNKKVVSQSVMRQTELIIAFNALSLRHQIKSGFLYNRRVLAKKTADLIC